MTEQSEGVLQRDIDRLVGGDATKEEMRELVARLDSSPGGWKRCALSYMESQSWRETFASMLSPRCEGKPDVVVATPNAHAPRSSRRNGLLLTVTGFLVAFAAGIGTTAWWQDGSADRENGSESVAKPDRSSVNPTNVKVVKKRTPDQKSGDPQLLGVVNITSDGVTEAAFPLVGTQDRELVSIELTSAQLSDYNRQLWQRRGYRIEQHRKIVSVLLAGGNRFQFPIDWVQFRYVGEPVY